VKRALTVIALLLALVPGVAAAQTQLRVIVRQGEWAAPLPRPPVVRVHGAHFDISRSANDALFVLPPGDYRVTVRLGTGNVTPPTAVTVPEGGTTELTIGLGSGRLEVLLVNGGQAFPGMPNLELRRDGALVRTASSSYMLFAAAFTRPQAVFDAPPGVYAMRILLPHGRQFVDIPDVRITAAQSDRQVVEAGVAELWVGWSRRGELDHGARPFPTVRVSQGGHLLATIAADPARFVLLPGSYEVVVLEASSEVLRQSLTLAAGETRRIEVGP
jgi:hypothetical protein